MDKKIKNLIAEKDLHDDQIFAALTAFITAESSDADSNSDGDEEQDQNEEENSGSDEDQNGTVDEEATDNDQEPPNMQELIDEGIAKALKGLSRGKKPPKVKPKKKKVDATIAYNFNQEFGTIP